MSNQIAVPCVRNKTSGNNMGLKLTMCSVSWPIRPIYVTELISFLCVDWLSMFVMTRSDMDLQEDTLNFYIAVCDVKAVCPIFRSICWKLSSLLCVEALACQGGVKGIYPVKTPLMAMNAIKGTFSVSVCWNAFINVLISAQATNSSNDWSHMA